MKKIVLKFGVISGTISASLLLISMHFLLGRGTLEYGELLGYAGMLVAFSIVFVGVKKYKDEVGNGNITYLKALQVGVLITLITSLFYVAGWMCYVHLVNPDAITQFFEQSAEGLRQSGLSKEELQVKLEGLKQFMEQYQNPFVMIGFTFIEIFPVGLLVSLVSAAILMNKKK